ncbi:tRNA dimethylallyltransferase [Glaciecola punicea ACAM 611]|jgi:tRNA dimethylallyltransferase|uniref:tRNA dimethylallyltransferase n=1 Tax=Glaciecola punicea ACAM 611 TaxID=1121923 RepID=H5TC34_9ALTE|nr:tRNA (adenosine(37)-N6)-dimethylallyltransferase MiaA [Glaciecola punicea]OFA32071.1 tRNA (adenosine(37)-N6)-dimethylallyltransferase MiaA [Glaciecola punicea]GAB55861.1 tRNA dimethylallyltransferase [Glaciecola punicea ACAM 611]
MSIEAEKNDALPTVICIMGPTASGKTALAIESAKVLNGEVISVDSALVYKDMDIGTAKPSLQEQSGVTHHLIDIISPQNSYSVANFMSDAQNAIVTVLEKGKQPILAGGTMMYFNALINGLNELPAAEPNIRQQISEMTLASVHKQLSEVDPQSVLRIDKNDAQRLTRALEVFMVSGKSLSHFQAQQKVRLPFNFCQFTIMPRQRADLHVLIEQRFDSMLLSGLVQEVKELLVRYSLEADMPSMRSVGYRQVWQYLEGEYSYSQMRERGIIATRQLAKRQLTWLRGFNDVTALDSADFNNLQRLVQKVGAT